jgi:flavodoxin/NAD-dependent dihydropyrimidine dehydrogenase PreA subunit
MKSIVIYYSQSGNTKKVAEAIHRGMSQTGEQCDIVPLRDINPRNLVDYDLIGLGSPVMSLTEPRNVSFFIEDRMESVEGKHAFTFCTHGCLPTHYLSSVVPKLQQRGLTVIGWNDWFGSVVYPVVPIPYFTDGHPDEIDLKEAGDFGREMVERSRRIYQGETDLIPQFPRGKEYDEIYDPPELRAPLIEIFKNCDDTLKRLEFKVNPERCNYPKCTHCIDNCPTGSILFTGSPPNLSLKCVSEVRYKCFLCEQTCPQGAIEVDYESYKKAHDPMVASWFVKTLEHFEKIGRFRRLVPVEDVGWDTPYWKTKKPPRFKIV